MLKSLIIFLGCREFGQNYEIKVFHPLPTHITAHPNYYPFPPTLLPLPTHITAPSRMRLLIGPASITSPSTGVIVFLLFLNLVSAAHTGDTGDTRGGVGRVGSRTAAVGVMENGDHGALKEFAPFFGASVVASVRMGAKRLEDGQRRRQQRHGSRRIGSRYLH